MPTFVTARLLLFLWLCLSLAVRADVQTIVDHPVPNHIRPHIAILSADWPRQIPATGRVNSPEILNALYPGQRIALALVAEGKDRENLFDGATLQVRLSSPTKGLFERHDLKPVAIRQIKAEGADTALFVLHAGGIAEKDRAFLENATSLVTFAVFQTDWMAPLVDRAEDIQITADLSTKSPVVSLEPATIKVRPMTEWLDEAPLSKEETNSYMRRYHEDQPPGRLLSLLRSVATDGGLNSVPVSAFFAITYQNNAVARNAAVSLFPSLDRATQLALMVVLRFGAQDISKLLPTVTEEIASSLKTIVPLQDPRGLPHFQDPVTPEAVGGIGSTMDQCWGGWMATGDQSYLRALVGLLEGAPDFPAFQSWTKARGGVKGLNAKVARGLAYQIAGWSLRSFQRTDPHVADWLLFWEKDPSLSPLLRQEIASLPNNPAFDRN